jgi:very-short-patch-repair endonuclease
VGLDERIARAAAQRFGLVTWWQLIALGATRTEIQTRVRSGLLIRVYVGVYFVGYVREDAPAQAMAAVLACGPQACLSFSSAAFVWGLTKRWWAPPEITVPGNRPSRKGIRIHRCRTLARRDLRRHQGIRITSPARTAMDIAPRLTDLQLARTVNVARQELKMTVEQLADVIERNPRHPGIARLRPYTTITTGPTRSEFEDRFQLEARTYGLPPHEVNVIVEGMLVDVLFRAERVIVELDSWEFHSDWDAFHTDRERTNTAVAAGYFPFRLTWENLTKRTEDVMVRLKRFLEDRSPAA